MAFYLVDLFCARRGLVGDAFVGEFCIVAPVRLELSRAASVAAWCCPVCLAPLFLWGKTQLTVAVILVRWLRVYSCVVFEVAWLLQVS